MESPGDVSLLTHESELALIRKMLEFQEVVALAATQLAPHHLTFYAQELASVFHSFYRDCRVVDDARAGNDPGAADAGARRKADAGAGAWRCWASTRRNVCSDSSSPEAAGCRETDRPQASGENPRTGGH